MSREAYCYFYCYYYYHHQFYFHFCCCYDYDLYGTYDYFVIMVITSCMVLLYIRSVQCVLYMR